MHRSLEAVVLIDGQARRSFHELRVLYPNLLPHLRRMCKETADPWLCAKIQPDPHFRTAGLFLFIF
jgi:hypothetical protein